MNLEDALLQIHEIRRRSEAAGEFRGYRSIPLALSAVVAAMAAYFQPKLIPNPVESVKTYVVYWSIAALLAALPTAVRIYFRDWRETHSVGRKVTRLTISQFLPCVVAGALIALVIVKHSPEFGWALPGLWQIIFSLGIFASARLLQPGIFIVGVFYLLAGAWNLAFSHGDLALLPKNMGVPFVLGQFFTAIILYWHEERNRARNNKE